MPEKDTEAPEDTPASLEDIDEQNELRELKVKLPLGHHVKLHGYKIAQGRSISDIAAQALEEFFDGIEDHPGQKGPPRPTLAADEETVDAAVAETDPAGADA